MARNQFRPCILFSTLVLLQLIDVRSVNGLSYDYYETSCPQLESIVKAEAYRLYQIHGNFATSSLRNLFHDCAVGTCDASVLLDGSTGNPAEMDSDLVNFGLRNFKYFDVVKTAVEAACPGVVSCADVLMLAGREGVINLKGPYIPMKLGRFDSKTSLKSLAESSLPSRNDNVSTVLKRFSELGIDTEHAVSLYGGHSVGRIHCVNLVDRLYPSIDPTLDATYGLYLRMRCPKATASEYTVNEVAYSRNDPLTPMKFDNHYFVNLLHNTGLLRVDQELMYDERTKPYVVKYAADNEYFFEKFSEAVQTLTSIPPLTSSEGEIRLVCSRVNAA